MRDRREVIATLRAIMAPHASSLTAAQESSPIHQGNTD